MILAVSKRRTLYLFFEYFPKQMNLFVKNKSCTISLKYGIQDYHRRFQAWPFFGVLENMTLSRVCSAFNIISVISFTYHMNPFFCLFVSLFLLQFSIGEFCPRLSAALKYESAAYHSWIINSRPWISTALPIDNNAVPIRNFFQALMQGLFQEVFVRPMKLPYSDIEIRFKLRF